MEAVCNKCNMRYEVSEELLRQGPVNCPSCQVLLTFVHPGSNVPLDPQPQATPVAPATAAATAAEAGPGGEVSLPATTAFPESSTESTTPPPEENPAAPTAGVGDGYQTAAGQQPSAAPQPPGESGTQQQAVAASSEPTPGWSAGDMQWGVAGQPPAAAVPAEEHDEQVLIPEVPGQPEAAAPPAEAAPGETAAQREPLPVAPEPAEPGPEPQAPAVPESAEPPQAQAPVTPEPAEPGPEPQVPAVPGPAEPPQAQEAAAPETAGTSPQLQAPAGSESEAAVGADRPGDVAFETPSWQPTAVPSGPAPAPEAAAPPTEASGPVADDWAAAAARWAASGFSADAMPSFVADKTGTAPSAPAAASTAAPPAGEEQASTTTTAGEPEAAAAHEESSGSSIPAASAGSVEPPPGEPPAGAAPPPLPQEQSGEVRPAVAPPPLRRVSTYVMRGSGEGVSEQVPWAEAPASEPPPPSLATRAVASTEARIAIPRVTPVTTVPTKLPEVPKPQRFGWGRLLLVLLLLAAGAALAWWWFKMRVPAPPAGDKVEVPASAPSVPVVRDAGAEASATDKKEAKPAPPAASGSHVKGGAAAVKPREAVRVSTRPGKSRSARDKSARQGAAKFRTREAMEAIKQGNALVRQGKYQKAVAAYRRAIRADGRVALAYRGLGVAYARLGKKRAACKAYRKYYRMLPEDSSERPQLQQILKACK